MLLPSLQSEGTMKKTVSLLAFGFLTFFALYYYSVNRISPLEEMLNEAVGKSIKYIGNTLGSLKGEFGDPDTISQMDGGHTFFYWPKYGFAVFCHPLYNGQHERSVMSRWVVTSLWVPLENNIEQSIVKTDMRSKIHFEQVRVFSVEQKKKIESDRRVSLLNVDGKLSYELRKKDFWFSYD